MSPSTLEPSPSPSKATEPETDKPTASPTEAPESVATATPTGIPGVNPVPTPHPCPVKNKYTISGRVFDKVGNAKVGAVVYNNHEEETTTDLNGVYSLEVSALRDNWITVDEQEEHVLRVFLLSNLSPFVCCHSCVSVDSSLVHDLSS